MTILSYEVKFETEADLIRFNNQLGTAIKVSDNIKEVIIDSEGLSKTIFKRNKVKSEPKEQLWQPLWNQAEMPHYVQEKGWCQAFKITFDESIEWLNKYTPSSPKIKSFWFSDTRKGRYNNSFITDLPEDRLLPQYTIYIPSKGRADCCKTADSIIELGITKFFIIVEAHQYDEYAKYYNEDNLLVLPQRFLDDYETLDDLGDSKSKGPGAARNFAWWHSVNIMKEDWHHVYDDNVSGWVQYMPGNFRIPIKTPTYLRLFEEFITQFDKVAIGGQNYRFLNAGNRPPTTFNTRIYSLLFIRNSIPYKWRGRFNEDTILSIDVMEDGWQTLQVNSLLANKAATSPNSKGGNSEDFYSKEGTTNKSQMLYDVYPQFTELVKRYNRDHHFVNYKTHWGSDCVLDDHLDATLKPVSSHNLYLDSARKDINPQCLI